MHFPFLPYRSNRIGWLLFLPGMVLGYLVEFMDFKPGFLDFRVFALHSEYLRTRTMEQVKNNISDELALIMIIIGLVIIIFSKEKNEEPRHQELRLKAMFLSVLLNSLMLCLSVMFVFGIGFLKMAVLSMFTQLLFYVVIFRVMVFFGKLKGNN